MSFEYLDNYRNPAQVAELGRKINDLAGGLDRRIRLMEVCGGHTMAIHRFGLPSLLPANIELISGPGCPVCVTPPQYIDAAIEWGRESGGILTSFGDLYRVPGSEMSLEDAAALGLDVRIVYSPLDALRIAEQEAGEEVLFLGVGFETTAPTVAATLEIASQKPGALFRVMSAHKTMPRALRALVGVEEVSIDGFILPGHVSTIIGTGPYDFLADEFDVACCVTGFEPVDILNGILSLTEQCCKTSFFVDNQYGRAVRETGNEKAKKLMMRVFETCAGNWRGIGCIEGSGLEIRDSWADYRVPGPDPHDQTAGDPKCRCGEVLRGVLKPPECPLFAKGCHPEKPVGPCMVSSEGACAAYYKYQKLSD